MMDWELNLDLNGDGILDSVGMDNNMDGQVDTILSDMDGDGYLERVAMDTNYDGVLDSFAAEWDSNGDGTVDTLVYENDYNQDGLMDDRKVYLDENGDGLFDQVTTGYDANEDGILDRFETIVDTDGDGQIDCTVTEELVNSENGVPDTWVVSTDADGDGTVDDVTVYGYDPEKGVILPPEDGTWGGDSGPGELEQFDPSQADPEDVCGDPAADMENWECQGNTNRCTLYSQKFVIEELTGQDVDIEKLVEISEENGWFTEENGGNALDMANVLKYYGLDPEMSYHNDMEDIRQCLENGGKVIVSVDSGEIWYGETDQLFCPVDGADHAVQVIGIDNSDPDAPMVILNDSGSPNGCGEMVPMEIFVDAWEDGNCQMIACY